MFSWIHSLFEKSKKKSGTNPCRVKRVDSSRSLHIARCVNVDKDVLVKLRYDFSEFARHVVENALNYSNIDSRVNIHRTCTLFNEIEATIDEAIR
ncbi:hypothetical protein CAEBREN_09532 [Caenorhabditis brenneri]|uniref:Uncharacterized protein n=1 Tax=Caenorhabditis brenneri TaxID=135651 RepID=G0NP86_CAEBE|nr:hypothetical protein CAEBREN_09532 [Caenorhabditis brenneri]